MNEGDLQLVSLLTSRTDDDVTRNLFATRYLDHNRVTCLSSLITSEDGGGSTLFPNASHFCLVKDEQRGLLHSTAELSSKAPVRSESTCRSWETGCRWPATANLLPHLWRTRGLVFLLRLSSRLLPTRQAVEHELRGNGIQKRGGD